jgi:hypothetical protein
MFPKRLDLHFQPENRFRNVFISTFSRKIISQTFGDLLQIQLAHPEIQVAHPEIQVVFPDVEVIFPDT